MIFHFFFVAAADVYRNEGNEAFKKGDFINAIHFYTKGIKMNCNEKELKAKLHNNRAIAHSKLGKMMRALTSFFFALLKLLCCLQQFSEKDDNFECMPGEIYISSWPLKYTKK